MTMYDSDQLGMVYREWDTIQEGFCPCWKICRRDFIHLVKNSEGDFILLAKNMRGG